MSCSQPTDCGAGDPGSPAYEDAAVEASVLALVFAEHPAHLTIPELALAMSRGREDFDGGEEVEQAIRELVGAGLLRIVDCLVLPTRAALYFDELGVD